MTVEEWCNENGEFGEQLKNEYVDERWDLCGLSIGSGRRVKWKCSKGHEWESELKSRIRCKSKCPYCAGKRILPGYNDLYTWCQNHLDDNGAKILSDWTGINVETGEIEDIHTMATASKKKLRWHCKECNETWDSEVCSRTIMKTYCPVCNDKKVITGRNDLYTWANEEGNLVGQELLKQWDYEKNLADGIDIHKIRRGSIEKAWLKCTKCNKLRQQRVNDFTRGIGCYNCSKKSTSYPEQYIYYAFKQLYENTRNRVKLFQDEYKNGLEFDIYIQELKLCIEYSPTHWHKDKINERDKLKEEVCTEKGLKFIQIIEDSYNEQEHYMSDTKIVFHMVENKKNEILQSIIKHMFNTLNLDINEVNIEEVIKDALMNYSEVVENNPNALINKYPQLREMYSDDNMLEFNKLMCGSSIKVNWICPNCGNEFNCEVSKLALQKKSCTKCGYNGIDKQIHKYAITDVIEGKTDLKTLYPELVKELIDENIDASKILPGSQKKVLWKCSNCNKEWKTAISHRVKEKSGCPKCHYSPIRKENETRVKVKKSKTISLSDFF